MISSSERLGTSLTPSRPVFWAASTAPSAAKTTTLRMSSSSGSMRPTRSFFSASIIMELSSRRRMPRRSAISACSILGLSSRSLRARTRLLTRSFFSACSSLTISLRLRRRRAARFTLSKSSASRSTAFSSASSSSSSSSSSSISSSMTSSSSSSSSAASARTSSFSSMISSFSVYSDMRLLLRPQAILLGRYHAASQALQFSFGPVDAARQSARTQESHVSALRRRAGLLNSPCPPQTLATRPRSPCTPLAK